MNDENKENSNFENEKYRPSSRENKKKKKKHSITMFSVQPYQYSFSLDFMFTMVYGGIYFILTTKSLRISPIIIMNMENKTTNKNKNEITSIHHFIFIIL